MKHSIIDDVAVLEPSRMLVGGDEDSILDETLDIRLGQGYRKFLIDLADVTTTNSTGRGQLIRLHKRAKLAGAQLVFCNLDHHLAQIFHTSKIELAVTIAKDRAQGFALLHAHSTG